MSIPAAAKLLTVFERLFATYGKPECPLAFGSMFQLLTAVTLSAQTTDKAVNAVTEVLFASYGTAEAMAAASEEEVGKIIRPIGLFRNKSKNLVAAARMICRDFAGEVPPTMAELVRLPGVGRKSANVILGVGFGTPGFPADTHVQRLLIRLGIVDRRDPLLAERVVCENLAPEYWTDFSHLLIQHGRAVCSAGKPRCGNCQLTDLCEYYGGENGRA